VTAVVYEPIGYLRTPFRAIDGMPIQPFSLNAATGTAHIDASFAAGLVSLDGFSHVILLYHLHQPMQLALTVRPFIDPRPRGVFATRAPARPNPIGLSVAPLLAIDGTTLYLDRLDMLDGTPLLDIKPYVPKADSVARATAGWIDTVSNAERATADCRFAAGGVASDHCEPEAANPDST
jgi:tRNA (adenine37-N6)-methyltransferase